MADKQKLVVLEESVLRTLASNPVAVTAFPFLRAVTQITPPQKKGCAKCQKKTVVSASVYSAVKSAIANMDATRKTQLKAMLNAHQLRVVYSKPAGDPKLPHKTRPVILTF